VYQERKASAEFDPARIPFDTTLARQIAKQHLSNFNNVFWVSERSFKLLRGSYTRVQMPTPGPGVHGYFKDESEWQAGADEFRTWTRQHVLISAASLLEVYIQSAATAALSASPELVDRSLRGTSGMVFIKFPDRAPKYIRDLIKTRVDSLTTGLWKDRFQRMALIFGQLPPALLELEKPLQSVQDRRNRIAHSYGIGGELRRTPWEPITAIHVAPSQLVDSIKLVSKAISLADTKVFSPHI
jgi:hypothetical protein